VIEPDDDAAQGKTNALKQTRDVTYTVAMGASNPLKAERIP